MTGRTLATLEEIMADFEWATTDKKDGDTDAVYRRYFPDILAIAQGQREELEKATGDSVHLSRCIAEFDRLKRATMTDSKIPFMQRVKDAVYIDGVLAVLTTRENGKNDGYRENIPSVEIDRELDALYGRLHMAAMDFVADASQKEKSDHAHIIQAVCALREYFHIKQEDRLNKRRRDRHQKVST